MTITTGSNKAALITVLCGTLFSPLTSLATSVLGGDLRVQHDGNVTATFQGSNAGYTSSLYLGDTKIFTSNQASGTTFDLGNFTAGTALNFRLEVHNTGHTFYSGNGSNNSDGLAHALASDSLGNGETLVSFEDLLGGGDQDYNDLLFSFSNTKTEAATEATVVVTQPNPGDTSGIDLGDGLIQNPEPSTVILLGSGLLGLAALRWRRQATEINR